MRDKKIKKYIILGVCFVLLFAATLLVEYCFDSSKSNFADIRHEIIKSILSSLIITVLIGAFTESITSDIIGIQKDNKKLREYGIYGIGTGTFSHADERCMFGKKDKYPQELRLMFLSGNKFLDDYKEKLVEVVANGCNVKVLLVRPRVDGRKNEYVKRYAEICPSEGLGLDYEVCCDSMPIIQSVLEKAKKINPQGHGEIELRTYVDEFRNNQRYARYEEEEGERIYSWLNVQSTHKTALSLSLLLRGEITPEELRDPDLEKTNLMYASYKSFEKLWNLYPDTQPSQEDVEIYQEIRKKAEEGKSRK